MAILCHLPIRQCPTSLWSIQGIDKCPSNTKVESIPVDLIECDTGYKVLADLPGFDRSQVTIEFDQTERLLQINADKTTRIENPETESKKSFQNERWLQKERISSNKMERHIELPRDVSFLEISATMRDGVLEITIPRSRNQERKLIQIN